jgi:hypothetical protein
VSTLYADTSVTTAAYSTRYLTQADGEQPGQWTGRQAALLGLTGEVTTKDLQALLEPRSRSSARSASSSRSGSSPNSADPPEEGPVPDFGRSAHEEQ